MRPKLLATGRTLVDQDFVVVAVFAPDYGHGAQLAAEVAARYNAAMTEARAREILGKWVTHAGGLHGYCVDWAIGTDHAEVEGWMTADQLEAIAWWMRKAPA